MSKQRKGESRGSFLYYADWAKQLLCVPSELRLKIDDAIKRYVLYGEEPTDREVLYSMFGLIRAQLDRDQEKYESKCESSRKSVIKRWERRKNAGEKVDTDVYDRIPTIRTYTNDTDNDNDNDFKENSNELKKVATKRAAFVAPSLEEAVNYFSEIKGTSVDAEAFCDHFTSNGWRVGGKSPMKDWKAAARQWMRGKSRFSNTKVPETSRETQPRYKAL